MEKEGEDQLKFAVLIGCLYDQLHSSSNPMDSTSDTGGFVDGYVSKLDKVSSSGIFLCRDLLLSGVKTTEPSELGCA